MSSVRELERQRDQVLEQMRSIRSMKRGTINQQYFPVIRGGKESDQLRGPYYVFSRREGKRTISRRLRWKEQVEQAREGIAAHQHFVALCKQFEELTERLGELQRRGADFEQGEKPRRLRSSKTGK